MAWGPYDFIVSILFTDKTGLSTNFKLLIFGFFFSFWCYDWMFSATFLPTC